MRLCRTRARRRLNSHDQAILEILAILAKEFVTSDIPRVTNHRLETASGERRHVAFVNGPRSFAKKDDDYELPNGLPECDGFGTTRRERVRVRGRKSTRRHDAEVRRCLRGLPGDVRFVLPSLRIARGRGEKGACKVHASLRGLRGVLQNVRDVVRTAKRSLRHCGGVLRQML